MVRTVPIVLLLVVAALSCGCEAFGKKKESHVQRPDVWSEISPPDIADATDEEDDEWSFVGSEARGNQLLERDPDPWWQEYIQSPKARSIERNLGIAGPDE